MNQTVHDELIAIRDLQISIQSEGSFFEVVKGVSLSIRTNEIVCLVGESGCGKSITALSVMGLLPADVARVTGGEILYRGQNLLGLKSRDMRRLRSDDISMIFQDPITSLDPVFTIGSLLQEVIQSHRKVSRSEAEKLAVGALEEAQLPDASKRMKSYPHELSGGMRQRVMIALATALNPSVLIADEPTTALDVTVQAQILESLRRRQRELKMGMLLITHDLAVVAAVADRVAVMYSGEIVEEAPVNDLFDNPKHPYTQGLLRSIPSLDRLDKTLQPIEGQVPEVVNLPDECRFYVRCPLHQEGCRTPIPMRGLGESRQVRCILAEV